MTYARRTDANHADIMAALRKIGASVQSLHKVGSGCPDIVVGFRGRCYLFEIKNGEAPPSDRQLTPDEEKWHKLWNGQVGIVDSAEEAVISLLRLAGLAAAQ